LIFFCLSTFFHELVYLYNIEPAVFLRCCSVQTISIASEFRVSVVWRNNRLLLMCVCVCVWIILFSNLNGKRRARALHVRRFEWVLCRLFSSTRGLLNGIKLRGFGKPNLELGNRRGDDSISSLTSMVKNRPRNLVVLISSSVELLHIGWRRFRSTEFYSYSALRTNVSTM